MFQSIVNRCFDHNHTNQKKRALAHSIYSMKNDRTEPNEWTSVLKQFENTRQVYNRKFFVDNNFSLTRTIFVSKDNFSSIDWIRNTTSLVVAGFLSICIWVLNCFFFKSFSLAFELSDSCCAIFQNVYRSWSHTHTCVRLTCTFWFRIKWIFL